MLYKKILFFKNLFTNLIFTWNNLILFSKKYKLKQLKFLIFFNLGKMKEIVFEKLF